MKNIVFKQVISKLIIVVLILMLFVASSFAEQQKIVVVGSWNNLTLYNALEKPFWTKTLPEAMNGKIDVTMTSLGQINVTGAAVLRQMEFGLFGVVSTVVDYVVSDCPELAGLDLPVLAPDIATARKILNAHRPVLSEVLEKNFNAKLLSIAPYPAQILFLNEKVSGLGDLKGKKIRASGWTTARFIEALGATGVNISFGEVPQSLQRGIVDGAVTGSLSGYSAGWGEVTSYIYPLAIGGWDYVMTVMNMDIWNKFNPTDQKLIQSLIIKEVEMPAWDITEKETQEGIDHLIGGKKDGEKYTYGEPNNLGLIEVVPGDIELARQILLEKVLPAWASQVDKAAVERWNDTIGKVVGIQIEK